MKALGIWRNVRRVAAVLVLVLGAVLLVLGRGRDPLHVGFLFDGTGATFLVTIGALLLFGETLAAMLHGFLARGGFPTMPGPMTGPGPMPGPPPAPANNPTTGGHTDGPPPAA